MAAGACAFALCKFPVALSFARRNNLIVSCQKAFYRKGRDKYKESMTKSVDIEGILRKPNLASQQSGAGLVKGQNSKQAASYANNISTANGKNSLAKEPRESWQHSTQRLNSLRTAEKRVAAIAVIVMLLGVIAIKYTKRPKGKERRPQTTTDGM